MNIVLFYRKLETSKSTIFSGGAQKSLYLQAVGLAGRGHHVWVASDDVEKSALVGLLKEGSVNHFRVGWGRFYLWPKSIVSLFRFIRKNQIEIIVVNDRYTLVIARILGFLSGVKTVFIVRASFVGKKNSACLMTPNCVAVSEGVKKHLIDYFRLPGNEISVIYNGRPSPRNDESGDAHPRLKKLKADGYVLLGIVGRIREEKGIQFALQGLPEILDAFPRTMLVIIGTGSYEAKLKESVGNLRLENHVLFYGYVETCDAVYPLFDLTLIPSRYEGLSGTAIESLLAGTPVIASDTNGLREIIVEGKNGMLIPPGEPKKLAEAVVNLLNSPERLSAMRADARSSVEHKFSLEKMLDRYETYYQSI